MPTCGSVNVVKQSARKTSSPALGVAWGGRMAAVPVEQVLALELRHRAGGAEAEQAFQEPAGRPGSGRQVRHRSQGRADPVHGANRAEQPGAQRDAVYLLVGGEELALEGGHVDAERALSLAGFTFQAQVEDLVQALAAEGGPRVRHRQGRHQGVCPAASAVLLVTGGHVGGAHDAGERLAAGADVHAAVGGGAHPAISGEP
jgi:hypothetical protein